MQLLLLPPNLPCKKSVFSLGSTPRNSFFYFVNDCPDISFSVLESKFATDFEAVKSLLSRSPAPPTTPEDLRKTIIFVNTVAATQILPHELRDWLPSSLGQYVGFLDSHRSSDTLRRPHDVLNRRKLIARRKSLADEYRRRILKYPTVLSTWVSNCLANLHPEFHRTVSETIITSSRVLSYPHDGFFDDSAPTYTLFLYLIIKHVDCHGFPIAMLTSRLVPLASFTAYGRAIDAPNFTRVIPIGFKVQAIKTFKDNSQLSSQGFWSGVNARLLRSTGSRWNLNHSRSWTGVDPKAGLHRISSHEGGLCNGSTHGSPPLAAVRHPLRWDNLIEMIGPKSYFGCVSMDFDGH
ncbi:hypothetical protein CVT26_002235 [Gymnopilus dilepis]|uniref:Uncharacterized protein n=1 Tax=Gymnopilus dilepis TaxID=231916 RepID=A0A409YN45_9AGAR|nr:hypothetical protein CVT26_002235 [Gymnopilus dilepis]